MFTLDTLPSHGVIRIYVTGERVTPESAEHGDAEERGWADSVGASYLYESRNDVRPVYECNVRDFDEDEREALSYAVAALGAYQTDDGSTLYGVDEQILDYTTADTYTYALHGHVKHYDGARGYVETDLALI